jgi:hypothetical protein
MGLRFIDLFETILGEHVLARHPGAVAGYDGNTLFTARFRILQTVIQQRRCHALVREFIGIYPDAVDNY